MNRFLLTFLIAILSVTTVMAQTTYYVKEDGLDSNNGESWDTAFKTLQKAIEKADVSEIYVAGGTYYPTKHPETGFESTNDRNNTFLITKSVKIYGGFTGTDEANERIDNRPWQTNTTTLSGDLGIIDDDTDNAYHVVVIVSTSTLYPIAPTLNGLTISGGYSTSNNNGNITITIDGVNQTIEDKEGAGIHNFYANTIIENVTIKGNTAYDGGGIFNYDSSPQLTDVIIEGNGASSGGGGIFNDNNSSPQLTNVTITGNQAGNYGGGMYNRNSSPILTNVTIAGNKGVFGGGIYNESASPILTNVTITGNKGGSGGAIYNSGSSPQLTNVTITGNQADNYGGGIYNINENLTPSEPKIRNSILWGNKSDRKEDNNVCNVDSRPEFSYSLVEDSGGSGEGVWDPSYGADGKNNIDADPLFVNYIDPSQAPTIEGDYRLREGSPAIDKGSAGNLQGITTDLDGNPRKSGSAPDMGAYEYQQINTTPPPSPNPTYTITIPKVEGVTTTPGAGLHELRPGSLLELVITPADNYNESEIEVYANDVLLQPVATGSEPVSYTYRIENVQGAVTFRIEGVKENEEVTGIDSPGSNPNYRLYTQGGALMIDAALPGDLTITAMDGRLYTRKQITEGTTRVPIPAGVYVVRIGDENYKVVVSSR